MSAPPLGVACPLGVFSRDDSPFDNPNPTYINDKDPRDSKTWEELEKTLFSEPAPVMSLEELMQSFQGRRS